MKEIKKRGLAGAISKVSDIQDASVSTNTEEEYEVVSINVEQIIPGKFQPRTSVDYHVIKELADSISANRLLQPIVIRHVTADKYEIVAGERRWRAFKYLGRSTIPSIIRTLTDKEASLMAIIENIQRVNLNPIEEALSFQRIQEDFGLTHDEIATSVSKSRSTITNTLRLLTLADDVRKFVEEGLLSPGHAKLLVPYDTNLAVELALKIIKNDLSVRATERLLRTMAETDEGSSQITTHHYEATLTALFGSALDLQISNSSGKGKLHLNYESYDDLKMILEKASSAQLAVSKGRLTIEMDNINDLFDE